MTWKTSDKDVVKIIKKVKSGKKASTKIKGVSAGTATVSAVYRAAGVKKRNLKCKVTVTAAEDAAGKATETPSVNGKTDNATATPNGNDAVKTAEPPVQTTEPGTPTAEPTDPSAPTEKPEDKPTATPTKAPTTPPTPTVAPPTPTPAPTLPPGVTPSPTPEPIDGTAHYTTGSITVDGVAESAWNSVNAMPLNYYSGTKGSTTAAAKVLWSTSKLYVLVQVTDPSIDYSNENAWEQDGLELFFDEDNSKESSYDSNSDAFQYRFTGLDGTGRSAMTNEFCGGSTGALAESRYAAREF
ncbi:MAG: hypothetical protein IKZ39_08760, partial [Lachnospiraceae bacterium]|nr:hypothetical protein [Lachnospiraceae bacterium]